MTRTVSVTIAILALLALAGLFILTAGNADAGTTLTYANFPPAKTFPCIQMERFKEEVEKRTGGKLSIQTFPGGTLLGAKNMVRGVQMGQADIGCVSLSYFPGVYPVMTSTNLPVGFSSATVASLTTWDIYERYKPKELSKVKVLTMFTSAPSNIMSKVPVKSLSDMKGLELRASGSILKLLEDMGAQPVGMPMSQTPEALQKGVVKGLVSSFDVLKDFNFAELCRYETVTNLPVYPFAVIMNKQRYNALPEDVKKVLDDLGREQALWTGHYLDNHVKEALAYSKEKYSVEVFDLPQQDMVKIQEIGEAQVDAWKQSTAKAGYDSAAIFNDMLLVKQRYEEQYPVK